MTLSRRGFLQGLAVAGVGDLTAAPDWEKLRKRLTGPLYLPQDQGYPEAKQGFSKLYDTQRPAAVVRCARVEDVQACVEVAATSRTPISARSGGHSYAGYSTRDKSLVVDLGRMDTIEVKADGTAVVGAGAQLIDIYETLARSGRMLPGGTCPSVGIGRLTLGGGTGITARKHGLTCDRLLSARVVTSDGRLHTVSAAAEPDLFWALRGGGGGNFGIVTSFTFRTAPATDLTLFEVEFPAAALAGLLAGWQDWHAQGPDEAWSAIGVPGDKQATVWVTGCYAGVEQALRPLLDDFVRRVGTAPLTRQSRQFGHIEMMRYFAGCSDLTSQECRPNWNGDNGQLDRGSYVATSRMITKPMVNPQAVADVLRSSPGLYTLIDSFGGAISRVPVDGTAFPHRTSLAGMQIIHQVDGNETAARQAIGQVRDQIGREFGEHGYVNYIDPQMPNWAQAYYGPNLPRLRHRQTLRPEPGFRLPPRTLEAGHDDRAQRGQSVTGKRFHSVEGDKPEIVGTGSFGGDEHSDAGCLLVVLDGRVTDTGYRGRRNAAAATDGADQTRRVDAAGGKLTHDEVDHDPLVPGVGARVQGLVDPAEIVLDRNQIRVKIEPGLQRREQPACPRDPLDRPSRRPRTGRQQHKPSRQHTGPHPRHAQRLVVRERPGSRWTRPPAPRSSLPMTTDIQPATTPPLWTTDPEPPTAYVAGTAELVLAQESHTYEARPMAASGPRNPRYPKASTVSAACDRGAAWAVDSLRGVDNSCSEAC
ncbi:FAD/FMN-containing dehydrogenase [Kibdelosporangium banguiense]|uniref:FAD/FMN-containing dehydrogenase n=1 Tax=Kibdelosporangium banguiense TaxID=1365924 RepID=A0ABS4TIM7_9PSEU|nr:FAD-binding oxidoreductase [Kibdelosporangium banguiense]MBP2324280.1 FAD/FMN-containing dehydrogenase [Kibdelosporangium banguiense]